MRPDAVKRVVSESAESNPIQIPLRVMHFSTSGATSGYCANQELSKDVTFTPFNLAKLSL
jgi:hypothetical protein